MNFALKNIRSFRIIYSFLAGTTFTMAQSTISDASTGCQRLISVTGDKGKQNDVIVCGSVQSAKQHIIFFGGDVQDYIERMNVNNPLESQWNLESSGKVILSQFPDAAVFVIKPSKMLFNTFSMYENFLYFDDDGIPEFTKDFGALLHLESLYKEAKLRLLNTELTDSQVNGNHGENSCQATGSGDKCFQGQPVLQQAMPLKLIGFSKGCVVLNQLIYELDTFKDNNNLNLFLSNVSEIYWLDGGHVGGSGAYIVEDDKLNDLKKLECKVFVHVTPYQICCPSRKWIGEEEVIFVDKLKESNVDVVEYRHFMDEPGSLENHFKVLTLL